MGLVSLSAGGLETRPAGHDAGLPGAGCPGRGSVVRDHEARDRTEPRLEGLWREPRRSAERRGRPQADDRGNADHSWRPPHWPRIRMRSSEAPVRIWTTRLSALRLPLLFGGKRFRAVAFPKLGRKNA